MAYEKEIRNSRILIVDDVVANISMLENVLNRMGYKQLQSVTETVELALAVLDWRPDLIVLELSTESISRLDVLDQMRSKISAEDWVPVLVLSADADPDLRKKAFASGVSEFLPKPFHVSELVVRIRNMLLMRTYHGQLRSQNKVLEYRVAARTKALSERTEELEKTLAQLKDTQGQIIQQERFRAFGEMAGGVAHDFNNVLMCVIGYTELLLNDPRMLADAQTARRFLRTMNTAGHDASKIVARLRDFYRPREQTDVFTPIDLNRLIEEVVPLTQPKWKAQALAAGCVIEIAMDLQDLPPIACNAPEIREVIVNLIFNAVDAMPQGGKITLCTRSEGSMVAIGIRDTGTGMTEEVRQRCMEPFFSTKGEKGTGLGLSMVFGIAKRHEGTVEIESALGEGTTFWMKLSRELKESDAEAVAIPELLEPLHILAVDDEPMARDIVSQYLMADGHQVELAVNGYEALEKLKTGHFDLIITDQAMPGMTGLQLAETIKKTTNSPILLLSGHGDSVRENGSIRSVDAISNKAISQQELRIAIARAIQRPRSVGAEPKADLEDNQQS
jgi:signal transduction histidine kinase